MSNRVSSATSRRKASGGGLLFPKGPTAKQLRARRRRTLKERDRAWQQTLVASGGRCMVGRNCLGDLCAHHVVGRRHQASRHDPANGEVLCFKHHAEFHQYGEKRFRERYGLKT